VSVSGVSVDLSGRVALLAAYDSQLRTEAEVATAAWVTRDGPVYRACFGHGRGFVTYRALDGFDQPADGPRLDALIERTIDFFVHHTDVTEVEWKTRGHDAPADLQTRLLIWGLVPQEQETVMIGTCASLDRPVQLPPGVRVRRLGVDEHGGPLPAEQVRSDLIRALSMQADVFGGGAGIGLDDLLPAVRDPGGRLEFWVVQRVEPSTDPTVLCAGRLEIVPGTSFAGLWGGATLPNWRGRGLYRALTAARARSAIARGATLLHSDCTDMSRPILQRAGLIPVTTTTPFIWHRPSESSE
jgi:hypothetical protein